MDVCCEYCVLSGRGLYDELITRSEDLETSCMRRPWPTGGGGGRGPQKQTGKIKHELCSISNASSTRNQTCSTHEANTFETDVGKRPRVDGWIILKREKVKV